VKAIAIFALTYIFISGSGPRWLPLGRTGGALLGAFLTVALGVVPFREAFSQEVVDWNTILLLLGMMVQETLLARAGLHRALVKGLVRLTPPPWATLGAVFGGAAILSAFLVNDAVCVFFAPFLFELGTSLGLAPLPLVWALIVGANVGSALTLSGNPQNAIIGTASGIHYLDFLTAESLPVVTGLVGAYIALLLLFRGRLVASEVHPPAGPDPDPHRLWRPLPGIVLTIGGYLLGYPVGGAAMAGALLSLLLWHRDASEGLTGVDWPLLALFVGLFIVMHGVETSGPVRRLDSLLQGFFSGGRLSYLHLTWMTFLGSQLLSNVPFVLLARGWAGHFGGAPLFWYTLGFVSTVAGCLTPVGSVVNLIALEEARKRGIAIGFWSFIRHGIPLTMAALLPGTAILLLYR